MRIADKRLLAIVEETTILNMQLLKRDVRR